MEEVYLYLFLPLLLSSSVSVIPTGGLSFMDRASLGGAFGILSDSGGGINGGFVTFERFIRSLSKSD